jgi:hypothetical protein
VIGGRGVRVTGWDALHVVVGAAVLVGRADAVPAVALAVGSVSVVATVVVVVIGSSGRVAGVGGVGTAAVTAREGRAWPRTATMPTVDVTAMPAATLRDSDAG